jgi:hypothetical protein
MDTVRMHGYGYCGAQVMQMFLYGYRGAQDGKCSCTNTVALNMANVPVRIPRRSRWQIFLYEYRGKCSCTNTAALKMANVPVRILLRSRHVNMFFANLHHPSHDLMFINCRHKCGINTPNQQERYRQRQELFPVAFPYTYTKSTDG